MRWRKAATFWMWSRWKSSYEELESNGIEVVDDDTSDAGVALTEDNVDDFEDSLNTDGITIDDPVKVYLKRNRPGASADAGGGDRSGPEDSGRAVPRERRPSSG